MSRNNVFNLVGIAALVVGGVRIAQPQTPPNFAQTVVVDPSDTTHAHYNTIQNAINLGIPTDPDNRWTILIYAGEYPEAVTLGDTKENVDLVGVDRDAVIIKPPANTDAITIQGDGARYNTIRNLTIIEQDDPNDPNDQDCGIIIKGQTTGGKPSAIKIVDVTIKCQGEKSNGIDGAAAEDVRIFNCDVQSAAGHGIVIKHAGGGGSDKTPKDITIEGVTIEADGSGMSGIYTCAVQDLRIANCEITTSDGHGIHIVNSDKSTESPRNVLLHDVTIRAAGRDKYAIRAQGAKGIPQKLRLRVNDLLLYEEAAPSEPNSGARKP